jgi:AcrR family transcriptional regulator
MATKAAGQPRYDLESLLAVAVRLFTERGFDGTSMGDLARAAGLSKSSLYHHVESKEQLLRLALDRAVDPLFAVLDEPGARDGAAVVRLEYVIRREVQVLARQLPYVTLLLRVRGNSPTERWALQRRRQFDQVVAALVAQASADGDVRHDLDPGIVAKLVFGMVNSMVEWYEPAQDVPRRADLPAGDITAETVVRLAFGGLRPDRPGPTQA